MPSNPAELSGAMPKRTPLFPAIQALGARTIEFGGWEMPVRFDSITKEHQAVRSAAGVFDISHMGKFWLRGPHLRECVQRLTPSDFSTLGAGRAQYSVLLNDRGGIVDDFIFYYQGERDGLPQGVAIVNAATREKDRAWMAEHLGSEIDLEDRTEVQVLIALQGPKAASVLQAFTDIDLDALGAFAHVEAQLLGEPAFIARTGYTGEDGFEMMLAPEGGDRLCHALLAKDVFPCGLGCRDSLRLEAAMALYGQDIDEDSTPLEAGLSWLVSLDRDVDFIGRSVLERQKREGVDRRLVGLRLQGRHIARHGYPVFAGGKAVGEVTSGGPSPTLGYPIALAYLPTKLAAIGKEASVEIRGKPCPAKVVKRPFYRGSRRR